MWSWRSLFGVLRFRKLLWGEGGEYGTGFWARNGNMNRWCEGITLRERLVNV